MRSNASDAQADVCARFGVQPMAPLSDEKVGVSRSVREGVTPINGMRHQPQQGTTGWFIWAGDELSDDPEFFVPLHAEHLAQWCPQVLPYLALPPGWRFLIAPDYEDVWSDDSLLAP